MDMENIIENKTADELYEFLLDEIHDNNIMKIESNNIKIHAPDIFFDKSRKTVWRNFKQYPLIFKRDEAHFNAFVDKELNTTTSINGENYLLVTGRKNISQFKSIIINYINNYVKCCTCKSMDTCIIRNVSLRLDFVKCNSCNTSTVVKK
jgi:translation initiation factor 2 subunit 2